MKKLITIMLFFVLASFTIAQGSLDPGLVAFYQFNGNAIDESGNANNGSLMNGVSFDSDRWNNPNQAIRFNKSLSQYVDVQNSSSLQIDSTISFSFWTKRNALDNGQDQVLNKGGDWPGGTCNYGLVFSEWTLCFIYNGGYYIVASPGVPLDTNWHHYAVTALNGTSEVHFYVDGVEKTSMFGGGNPVINLYSQSTSDLYLGGVIYYSNNTMDELKIYKRILSEDEIKSLYSNLVAYYPFNGNANDESGNGYNGSISGATLTTDRFNEADNAYNFVYNGFSSDKIQVNGTSGLNFSTGGFSLSAWIKFSGTAGAGNNYPIISKHICGEQSGYILMLYNGKLTFWLAGASGYNILSTSADYTDETWHQVVAVYDDVNQYIYVDGVLKNSIAFDYNVYNPADWALGGYSGCNGGFNGKVDEIKIYNRPLSDAEILDEYNNTYNDLVLFLPFNGNANDESGNGNDGTVANAVLTSDRFNQDDGAYYFNGSNARIEIPGSSSLNIDNQISISAWVKPEEIQTSGDRMILGKSNYSNATNYIFRIIPNGYIQWEYAPSLYTINNPLTANTWHHVVLTSDSTNGLKQIFINGDLIISQVLSGMGSFGNVTNPLTIGSAKYFGTTWAEFFKGSIDDVRIYNRAITSEQVLALYQDSTTYNPPLEDGLVAYWPLDGNTDDSTSNNNNGINYNGVFSKDRYGNDNTSIYFDGVDSYIEGINPGNNLPIGNSSRSFSAWVRNNQYNQYGSNIFHYGTQQAAPTNFHFLITDVLGLGNGYGYGVVYGNTNLIDSTWHFVTGVYEGGTERTTKLYIDGKLDVTGAITTEPNTVLTNNWRIGRFMEGSSNFNGNIDELKVYDIPLTDQQVWDMYKETTTAPTLLFPGNDSTLINPTMIGLVLDWDSTVTATGYRFLLANDSLFNTVIHDTLVNTSSFNFYNWFAVNIDNLYWKVRTINDGGTGPWSEINRFNIMLTDVEEETQLPKEFALLQNYPNPFNPTTTITYHLPKTASVELKVYDVLGNEITTLVNEEKPAGIYKLNYNSSKLASGVYLYKLQAGDFVETRKMILMR